MNQADVESLRQQCERLSRRALSPETRSPGFLCEPQSPGVKIMSLAETHRGTFRRLPVFNEPRPRWVYEFAVEDICVSEREATEDVIPLPAAVDSKVLFLTSARLPHSDRLQVNFGRFLQYLHAHMEGVWHSNTTSPNPNWYSIR